MRDLRAYDERLATALTDSPVKMLPHFETAAKHVADQVGAGAGVGCMWVGRFTAHHCPLPQPCLPVPR